MSSVQKVLVVGGGIGGLAAGAALAQKGVEVEIAEKQAPGSVYGVGINQPGNALRALKSVGVLDEVLAAGFEFEGYRFCDHRGTVAAEVPFPWRFGEAEVPPNNALSRRDLQDILTVAAEEAGAKIRYETTLNVGELAQDEEGVEVAFDDGRREGYDLVVGFDGIRSSLRGKVLGDAHKPAFTGYSVWRVTMDRHPEADCCTLFQGPGTKAGYCPLSEDKMYLLHVTPEPGNPRYDVADFADMMRERLRGFTGPIGEVREALKDSDEIVYSPLEEVLVPPPWHKGRVVILGDAAHACTPHITQGAAMALEDAVVLAEMVGGEGPLSGTLEAFGKRRYPRAKFVQDVSRKILEGEMQINDDTLELAMKHTAEEIPKQMAAVGGFLKQPA